MDPGKLKDWMEVVGLFALVASLVFVGLQMKQAQEIAIAEQYQARGIYGAEHVGSLAENEHLLEFMAKDFTLAYAAGELDKAYMRDYEAHGAAYVASGVLLTSKGLVTMDSYYFQYQKGFMEEEAWLAFRYRLKNSLRDGYAETHFRNDPQSWRVSFRELCEDLLAEIAAESTRS